MPDDPAAEEARLRFRLDLLVERWVPLPALSAAEFVTWARDAAGALTDDEDPTAFAAQLLLWADDPGRADVDVAAVLVPDGLGVLAWLTATSLPAGPGAPASIEHLEHLARQGPLVREPEVGRVLLPAGPAVRSRAVFAVPREDGLGEVVEQVQWRVLPDALAPSAAGPGGVLEVTLAWTAAAASEADELARLGADIVATLEVRAQP